MTTKNWWETLTKKQQEDYLKEHPNSKRKVTKKAVQIHKPVSKPTPKKPVKTKKHSTQSTKFKKWFGASKVKDDDGRPKVVYHGTPFANKLVKFNSNPKVKGVDQLGSGFYFTTAQHDANAYTVKKEFQKDEEYSPGVIPVYLSIKKPIKLSARENLSDAKLPISKRAIMIMIKRSHKIHGFDNSPLWNYIDLSSEQITDSKIEQIADNYMDNPFTLENDFFDGHEDKFRAAIYQFTNHDGIMQEKDDGITHYVAWFPWQIKSALANVGSFSKDEDDITASLSSEESE